MTESNTQVAVRAQDLIDDDSDFYGSEAEVKVAKQQDRPSSYYTKHYWQELHPKSINVLANKERAKMANQIPDLTLAQIERYIAAQKNVFNPMSSEKQTQEAVDEFLVRAPPLESAHLGDWLWIHDPNKTDRKPKPGAEAACRAIIDGLKGYDAKRAGIEAANPNMHKSTVTRRMNPDRTALRQLILDKAIEAGETSGKWMLFPTTEDVPHYWSTVCHAVFSGKLGMTAKIASGVDASRDGSIRLICVYVQDFSDERDVRRVAQALLDLDLFAVDGRPIYFKPDVFTLVGLESNNRYNIAVSIYSSHEMLGFEIVKGSTKRGAKTVGGATEGSTGVGIKKAKTEERAKALGDVRNLIAKWSREGEEATKPTETVEPGEMLKPKSVLKLKEVVELEDDDDDWLF